MAGVTPGDHLEIERVGVAGRAGQQDEDDVLRRVLGRAARRRSATISAALRVLLGQERAADAGAQQFEEVAARPVRTVEEASGASRDFASAHD